MLRNLLAFYIVLLCGCSNSDIEESSFENNLKSPETYTIQLEAEALNKHEIQFNVKNNLP